MRPTEQQIESVKYLAMLDELIRFLAERNSQLKIASLLNEAGLVKPTGKKWGQHDLSRYFTANKIKTAHQWRGTKNKNNKDAGHGLSTI